MARTDHPNNVERGGVHAYIGESLPVRNFSNSYLRECLTLEVKHLIYLTFLSAI